LKQYPVENLGAPDTIISRRQNQYLILSQSGCARLSNADCQGINALSLDWSVTSVSCRAARACVTVSVPCSRKVMPVSKKARPQSTRTPRERVRVLITGARIQKRIQALAREIRKDFPGEPLHLISVLKGGVFFLTDLARSIPGEVSFDFIAVSSYGQKTHSSGQVRLTRDLDSSIEGKTVIVVEDILDTGMTLRYLLRLFQQRKPKHLRVAVLLDKPERRIAAVRADYVGFSIPNEFVVGYGLDYAERYRNLPYVGILVLGPGLKKKPAED